MIVLKTPTKNQDKFHLHLLEHNRCKRRQRRYQLRRAQHCRRVFIKIWGQKRRRRRSRCHQHNQVVEPAEICLDKHCSQSQKHLVEPAEICLDSHRSQSQQHLEMQVVVGCSDNLHKLRDCLEMIRHQLRVHLVVVEISSETRTKVLKRSLHLVNQQNHQHSVALVSSATKTTKMPELNHHLDC